MPPPTSPFLNLAPTAQHFPVLGFFAQGLPQVSSWPPLNHLCSAGSRIVIHEDGSGFFSIGDRSGIRITVRDLYDFGLACGYMSAIPVAYSPSRFFNDPPNPSQQVLLSTGTMVRLTPSYPKLHWDSGNSTYFNDMGEVFWCCHSYMQRFGINLAKYLYEWLRSDGHFRHAECAINVARYLNLNQ